MCLGLIAMWAVHAGIDWDWEVPAVTLWLFALAGAALAARRSDRGRFQTAPSTTPFIGLGVVAAGFLSAHVTVAHDHLDRAQRAFDDGSYNVSALQAKAAIRAIGSLADPYEMLGYSELNGGRPRRALTAMREAVKRDPQAWRVHSA